MPSDVAEAVAHFVGDRAHDPQAPDASAEENDQRWADNGLVRDFYRAVDQGHFVTADNLAYTLLISAARHRDHRDYRDEWLAWSPFGDLAPGSTTDGPSAAEH